LRSFFFFLSVFRLKTKLAESWAAPPPFRHLAVAEPQQKGGGHLATLQHIFVRRTELGTVDGSMSGGEVHGIFPLFKLLLFETIFGRRDQTESLRF